MPVDPPTLAAARLKARAFLLLGRNKEAAALLTAWLARLPDHAGLQADLVQSELESRLDHRN
jgi:hypothetical protein